eukprot:14754527-Alexandrium_andersonii.AAC.1
MVGRAAFAAVHAPSAIVPARRAGRHRLPATRERGCGAHQRARAASGRAAAVALYALFVLGIAARTALTG